MDSQGVATVPSKRPVRAAAAGAGGGDFGGVSVIQGADSESASELLEEGQTFEAGIVSGAENAPDPDQGEVRTKSRKTTCRKSTTTKTGRKILACDRSEGGGRIAFRENEISIDSFYSWVETED